jgi:hypothetical protein
MKAWEVAACILEGDNAGTLRTRCRCASDRCSGQRWADGKLGFDAVFAVIGATSPGVVHHAAQSRV